MSDLNGNNSEQPRPGFFAELGRRRVLHVAGAYIAGAWLGTEMLNFLFEQFQAPGWAYRLLAILFVVGFPISMVLAWTVQVQEDGTWAIDRERGEHRTVAIAIALGLFVTATLSWLLLPDERPGSGFVPMPGSIALMPPGIQERDGDGLASKFYRAAVAGLEHASDVTLVRLPLSAPSEDPIEFGLRNRVARVASLQLDGSNTGATIAVNLFDVRIEELMWSRRYEVDDSNWLEVSRKMTNDLMASLSLPALALREFAGTENREAYIAYLSGVAHASRTSAVDFASAIEEFQRSIDLEPGYAWAYLGLAEAVRVYLVVADVDEEERISLSERAGRATDLAQKLDRNSADAVSLLGLSMENRQLRIQAFERALQLDPDHYKTYHRYALLMLEQGKLKEASRLAKRALELAPLDQAIHATLADIEVARSARASGS